MATIGAGLIILAVIWIVCIALCLVLSRAKGGLAYAGIGTILLAIIITLILWFIPRGTQPQTEYIVYDYTYILRTALVCVCAIFLFFGMLVVTYFHIFDQKRGAAIK